MLSEFTKQFNNTDLDGIQAVKGVCLESMEKYQGENQTKQNGAFYLLFELYQALWHKENELLHNTMSKEG